MTKGRTDLIEIQEAKERVLIVQRKANVKNSMKNLGKKKTVDESEVVVSKPPVSTGPASFSDILKLSRASRTEPKKNTEISVKKVQFAAGKSESKDNYEQRKVTLKDDLAKLRFQIRSVDHNKSSVLDNCARISLSNSLKINSIKQDRDTLSHLIKEAEYWERF